MSDSKNKSILENKLLKYSMAAGALLACADSADAAVVRTESGVTIGTGIPFPINFGGQNEYALLLGAPGQATLMIYASNSAICYATPPYFPVIPLATTFTVSAGVPWIPSPAPGNLNGFKGMTDTYIGVKFFTGAAINYGWISISIDAPGTMLTINGWAYEDGGGAIHIDGILPVELTSFNALQLDGAVKLLWETATEVNNHGFEVERSAFRGQRSGWEKVGFVEGAGNSNVNREYSFIDNSPLIGEVYYRLKQIDNDGTFDYSDEVKVTLDGPDNYALQQNYPNPFNPVTSIRFTIPESSLVTLKVYNSIGELVAELLNQNLEAGSYDVDFDASNLPSGAYIYKITAGSKFSAERKMLVVK